MLSGVEKIKYNTSKDVPREILTNCNFRNYCPLFNSLNMKIETFEDKQPFSFYALHDFWNWRFGKERDGEPKLMKFGNCERLSITLYYNRTVNQTNSLCVFILCNMLEKFFWQQIEEVSPLKPLMLCANRFNCWSHLLQLLCHINIIMSYSTFHLLIFCVNSD